jgi:Mn-containing catalase
VALLFDTHLAETETHVERLTEALKLLDTNARATTCKGMQGLIEEGEEVMADGKKKDNASADLALIAAAQKLEHYEISAYTSCRNLAQQLRMNDLSLLLSLTLGEEENANQLLDQAARPLMGMVRAAD